MGLEPQCTVCVYVTAVVSDPPIVDFCFADTSGRVWLCEKHMQDSADEEMILHQGVSATG